MLEAVSEKQIKWFQQTIIKWGKGNFATFPWRYTNNQWHALVAEIMLQRTRADQVTAAYTNFVTKYSTPAAYLNDQDSDVFGNLGLRWREPLLKQLAKNLMNSKIPLEKDHLLQLPGVGEYIASAYRSMHLGLYDVIIDSNVVRIYGRFFGFETGPETRRKKWFIDFSNKMTPEKNFKAYNYGVIDFTREICKVKPLCHVCPARKKCLHYSKST